MQYRSSAELVNKFKIKREQLQKQHNDKLRKEHAPISHRRKNLEGSIPQDEKSKLFGQKKGVKFPMPNFRFQTSSKEDVKTPHVIVTTLGEGEEYHDIQELQNIKQVKRKSVLPATSLDQFLEKQGINEQHDIQELLNCKQVKRKSVLPTTDRDQFLKKQRILLGDEIKYDNRTTDDVEFMHAPLSDEHNKGFDDLMDQEEIGEDGCSRDEEIDNDCSTKGISDKKKVRGETTCKEIQARNLEEREEVTFDKGQAVGPTNKIVSNLTNFMGTIARNPRFISLMYSSWHAVPDTTKKRMWEYINSKFLIPAEGEKWVMTDLRDAWRRHKRSIKERFFNKNSTIEDMLAKRPGGMPEVQFEI